LRRCDQCLNDREGNLWTLTDSGVDVFRELSILSLTTREGLSDDSAAAVEIAPDAAVWIGTRYALNIMRDQQISILRRGHGTPPNSANVLYRDSRNTMWMTDEVGHLFRYRDGQFTIVSTESGGVDYYIWGVTEDKDGEIWLSALERGNLSHRRNALLRVQDSHIGEAIVAPDNQLMFLAPHPQGGYWAGGYIHVLFRFKDGRFEEVSPELSHEGMRLISSELNGGAWIFTAQHVIFRYQDQRTLRLTTKNGLPCDTGSQVVDDHNGSHWFYLTCGIVKIQDDELARW